MSDLDDGVTKGPCPKCGSSDANATYPDGHSHCYSMGCGHHTFVDGGETVVHDPLHEDLVPVEICAIPARKLTLETCKRYGYGVHKGQQVAPYKDDLGRTVAQKVRTRDKDFYVLGDRKRMRLFGQHLSKGGGKYLTICEGEVDTLTMSQLFKNQYAVVGVPNGAQSAAKAVLSQLEFVESFERVVICMDQDEPGQAAAEAIAALLAPGKAAIMQFDGKDPNELLKKNRTRELITAFWEAKPYRPDGLMTGAELWEGVVNSAAPASVAYPHAGLQARTDGSRAGQIITVAAGPAAGKTTWCAELANHYIDRGHKVGYISLEQNERSTLLSLLTPQVNVSLHRQKDLDLSRYSAAWSRISPSLTVYRHCGKLDADSLEEKARFMAKGDGCQFIFVDNLSVVVSSSDSSAGDTRLIDEIMRRLVSLVQETDVTIILVVHLKRPGMGKGYSEGRVPKMEDVRGSGMIEAFSHDMIALSRDQAEGTPTEVHLLKCRQTGEAGFCGYLEYNPVTGRLTEFVGDFEKEEGEDY